MGTSILKKLGGVAIAIVVALVFFVVRSKGEEKVEQSKAPDVGECVYFKKEGANDKPVDASCGSDKSSHKVVGDSGKCGENETTYQVTRGGSTSDAIVELCMVLDAKKGDCFDIQEESKVPCASSKTSSVLRVTSVGKAKAKCGGQSQPLAYPKRDTTLCLVPNA